MDHQRYILTLSCPDRTGIVAAVASFMARHNGSIVEAHHHSDRSSDRFFMRQEVLASSLNCELEHLRQEFQSLAGEFHMDWGLVDSAAKQKVVILVSRQAHCLDDLLYRWRSGEMHFDLAGVISNHEDSRSFVEWHGVPFLYLPIDKNDKETGFRHVADKLESLKAETVVLARYMQIIPGWLCKLFPNRMLNIHHSFLPSFKGARPYHQAHERGVKFVGASCHYVTEDLDEGPIIEQDASRTAHTDTVEELVRMGRDIEKTVLARGLRYHLEHRIFVTGRRTIIFD